MLPYTSFDAKTPKLPIAAIRRSVPARGEGPTTVKMDAIARGVWMF
jgi:hypothetical protein